MEALSMFLFEFHTYICMNLLGPNRRFPVRLVYVEIM